MATKPKYGQLNLYRDQIETTIIAFFTSQEVEYKCGELKGINETRYRVEFEYLGEKQKIDFHFNRDGTTTIDLTPGGYTDIKEELAIFIKESPICQDKKISAMEKPWYTFDKIEEDEFDIILGIYRENPDIISIENRQVPGGKQYVLKSKYDETVTVSYFNRRKKAMIQGRPLKMFTELYTSFITLIDIEEIPAIMNQQLKIASNVTKDSIEAELEIYLPHSIEKISIKVKTLCYQSVYNLKVIDDMFDYGFLAFPSLRVLEGHLKHIMKEKNISLIDGKFSMFMIPKDGIKRFVIDSEYESFFTASEKVATESAYNYYHKNRHSIFHWGDLENPLGIDRTRMIQRIEEVHGVIIDVLSIVDNYYK